MNVTLIKRGISLRATWEGLAKPSAYSTSHWVRVNPKEMETAAYVPSTVTSFTAPMVQKDSVVYAITIDAKLLALINGSVGQSAPDQSVETPVRTAYDPSLNPIVSTFFDKEVDARTVLKTHLVPFQQTLLRLIDSTSDLGLRSRFDTSTTTTMRFVTGGIRLYKAIVGVPHATSWTASMLRLSDVLNSQALVSARTHTNPDVIDVRAPLPNASFFEYDDRIDGDFLPETPVGHLTRILPKPDAAHTDMLAQVPIPTHYVMNSHQPLQDPEARRRKTLSPLLVPTKGRLSAGSASSYAGSSSRYTTLLSGGFGQSVTDSIITSSGALDVQQFMSNPKSLYFQSTSDPYAIFNFKVPLSVSRITFMLSSVEQYRPTRVYVYINGSSSVLVTNEISKSGQYRSITLPTSEPIHTLRVKFAGGYYRNRKPIYEFSMYYEV